jgi:hypothetical protein
MWSSASLKLYHVFVYGVEQGGLGEGVRQTAFGKWGSRFSTWVHSGVRIAPCYGHHPKLGTFHILLYSILLYNTVYIFLFCRFFLGAPKSIYCCSSQVSGCDGGNRARNMAVYTWRFGTLSYKRHSPLQVKNKPSEGVTTPAFILGPISMIVNRLF